MYMVVDHQLLDREAPTIEKHDDNLGTGSDDAHDCINEGKLSIW